MHHILIIDDDLIIQRELKLLLQNAGYRVTVAEEFDAITSFIGTVCPDLIILDISLPHVDGIKLCSEIRMNYEIPIIFVTSQNSSSVELECMMTGGDDFIEKPYRPALLLAHIAAVLRRIKKDEEIIYYGDLELNMAAAKLKYHNQLTDLSKNELHILHYFFTNKGRVISREDLMNTLWDNESFVDDNTLSVNIKRIRNKLELIGITDLIQTKRGIGYELHNEEVRQ